MRFIDRLIVLVLSLALLALGAGAIWLCFDYQGSIVAVSDWLAAAIIDYRWGVLIGGAILVILAVIFIFTSAFHSNKGQRISMVNSAEYGDKIQISVDAIDCIISQIAKDYAEVATVSTKIHQEAEGIAVSVKLSIQNGTNIPDLATKLQDNMKLQLESMAGLKVADVKIIITEVLTKTAELGGK